MFYFKVLTSLLDLQNFKQNYELQVRQRSNFQLESAVGLDYLQHAKVVACFNRQREMIAGYVINHHRQFRTIQAIPCAAESDFLTKVACEEMCELTVIWRNPAISQPLFACVVWPKIIVDCLREGKRYILGLGYQNKMHNIYQACQPLIIYSGLSASFPDTHVYIYAYTRFSLCVTFLVNFYERMLRDPVASLCSAIRKPRP